MNREPNPIHVAWRIAARIARQWQDRGWAGDPRELLGAAWEGAWRHLRSGRPPSLAWLAARRAIIDVMREQYGRTCTLRYRCRPHQWDDVYGELVVARPAPETETLLDAWCELRYWRDLARLAPLDRLWLYLATVEGWRQKQIAQIWGCTEGCVYVRMSRAKKMLHEVAP